MEYMNVSESEAEEIAEEIKKQREKYFPQGLESSNDKSAQVGPGGSKLSYLDKDKVQNATEDEANRWL